MTTGVWHLKIRASRGLDCSRTGRREGSRAETEGGRSDPYFRRVIVSVLTARTLRTARKSAWTRCEDVDFEAGLNVKESLDMCHIYRQSMAKGRWPVCLPPSTLSVCTSDKCFVRYGTLSVGLKLAVCFGAFSGQDKGGVIISLGKI